MHEVATLITSNLSPFGRIVRTARLHMGLQQKILLEQYTPEEAKTIANLLSPIGKVPLLSLRSGGVIIDSRNILEFFYELEPDKRLCPTGSKASEIQSRLALVCGILDAALLLLYEDRFHAEDARSDAWVQLQSDKISRTLKYFFETVVAGNDEILTIDGIAFAIALEYLAFRFGGRWSTHSKSAAEWIGRVRSEVPSLEETSPT